MFRRLFEAAATGLRRPDRRGRGRVLCAKFDAFAFLSFQRLGRSDACSRALSPALLSLFDDVAAEADGPLDPVPRVARERDVSPAVSGL
jgi:hypothetical protein